MGAPPVGMLLLALARSSRDCPDCGCGKDSSIRMADDNGAAPPRVFEITHTNLLLKMWLSPAFRAQWNSKAKVLDKRATHTTGVVLNKC